MERSLYDDVYAESLADWLNERDFDEDRRRDAAMEEWDDAHPHDMRCSECGTTWWGNWARATRIDPAYPRNDVCPNCGA